VTYLTPKRKGGLGGKERKGEGTCPEVDDRIWACDPGLVSLVDIECGSEVVRPVDHTRKEVRVRIHDRGDATQLPDLAQSRIVQKAHAIPQDIAFRCAVHMTFNEQGSNASSGKHTQLHRGIYVSSARLPQGLAAAMDKAHCYQ
jgi:hypothetical protein